MPQAGQLSGLLFSFSLASFFALESDSSLSLLQEVVVCITMPTRMALSRDLDSFILRFFGWQIACLFALTAWNTKAWHGTGNLWVEQPVVEKINVKRLLPVFLVNITGRMCTHL
jgi:hypothetical protein